MQRQSARGSSSRSESVELASFLTPPSRFRSSVPPPPEPAPAPPEAVVHEADPEAVSRPSLFSELPIPRSRRHSTPVRPVHAPETPRAEPPAAPEVEPDPEALAPILEPGPDETFDVVPSFDPIWTPLRLRGAAIAGLALAIVVVALIVRRGVVNRAARASAAAGSVAAQPMPIAHEPLRADDDLDLTDDTPTQPPDPARAERLRREARAQLEGGHVAEGVALARRAVQADPSQPEAYILLAAGLQDQGSWQESHDVFAACVRRASRGNASECVYFATKVK